MATPLAADVLATWPEESREAAAAVVDAYGEPDDATDLEMTWHNVGPWKRISAQRAFWQHDFPAPHTDSVESFIDYRVPPEMAGMLAEYDGSVMVERTTGEVSARCHDEQANSLALNLMHDIVTGVKSPEEARAYYGVEFLAARQKRATPFMDKLWFEHGAASADPDVRTLTEEQLERAVADGKAATS